MWNIVQMELLRLQEIPRRREVPGVAAVVGDEDRGLGRLRRVELVLALLSVQRADRTHRPPLLRNCTSRSGQM